MSRRFFSRGPLLCLGTILLVPVVVLYLTQVIWLESLSAPFPWLVSHPAAVGLFWVIFSSFCLTLYGFSRRVLPSYLPAAVVLLLLSHASWCKMKINGAPIQLSDFTLLGNIKDITGFAANQLLPSPPALAAAAITLLLFVFLGRMEKHWRLPPGPGLAIGGVAMALFFSLFYPGTLQSAAAALDEGCADQVERNDRAGVALGVYTAWATRQLAESGGNDADAAELAQRFLADAQAPGETLSLEEAPDIIFIVSESFFDVTRLPGLTFQEDPLPVFHALSETCTNGRFLSNTYGGGTGYVEMEMFTGLTSSLPIARRVVEIVGQGMDLVPRADFQPERRGIPRFREKSPEEQAALIAQDPEYGDVVCRCRTITRAELRRAVENPLGVKTLAGIKYRAWATTGRCNGGYCLPKLAQMLVEDYGLDPTQVTYRGPGSPLFTGRVKP